MAEECALVRRSGAFWISPGPRRSASIIPHQRFVLATKYVAFGAFTRRGGLGEIGVCVVVAAKDAGQAAEEKADRPLQRWTPRRGPSFRPVSQPVQQWPAVPRIAAFDGDMALRHHCGEQCRAHRDTKSAAASSSSSSSASSIRADQVATRAGSPIPTAPAVATVTRRRTSLLG